LTPRTWVYEFLQLNGFTKPFAEMLGVPSVRQ
jgi:hypothetical protein